MKISAKGRYAVQVMVDLAMHDNGECIKVKDIARRQGISEKYLEQIIGLLNKAGYVHSIRGAQGGYRLTKDPKEYTVGMILRQTEGNLAPVACIGDDKEVCDRKASCITVRIYEKINDAVNDVVDHITLADMVAWQKEQ